MFVREHDPKPPHIVAGHAVRARWRIGALKKVGVDLAQRGVDGPEIGYAVHDFSSLAIVFGISVRSPSLFPPLPQALICSRSL